ncbi:MAG: hypothetical protein COY66_05380 [Candidatus Kerfeldbacteria bacterium CG_4_10_14_0_8_um_filter_42_10]|uniref:Uncharacterized protein n=1 Tax=Candidatus Kerfeldbacteria bacterium CG_4_10_14_0_8_um_filter_42_10 TaxID=2014248 RepID=A0A2M7RGR5_9BACT|nr:MAG: hypothetical protein COY66_05380 [Candidatus Kerfeldbacteria bacterium CG_4_10_14_0_8_um_filter_42_10]
MPANGNHAANHADYYRDYYLQSQNIPEICGKIVKHIKIISFEQIVDVRGNGRFHQRTFCSKTSIIFANKLF